MAKTVTISFKKGEEDLYKYIKSKSNYSDFIKNVLIGFKNNTRADVIFRDVPQEEEKIDLLNLGKFE